MNDISIQAAPLRYQWRVIYKDMSQLAQNYLTPEERNITHIDIPNVAYYLLEDSSGNPVFGVNLLEKVFMAKDQVYPSNFPEDNPQLVFFRRTLATIGGPDSGKVEEPVYYLGMRNFCDNCKQPKKQVMMFVNTDDSFGFTQEGF